jgi:cell division protein ZapA
MAQVTVKINGYAYPVGCDDGQETHLARMAESVEERINSIKALGGQSGESRLLVLAALLMADELHDQAIVLEKLKSDLSHAAKPEAETRRRMARLADKAEDIASGLEQT